MSIENQDKSLFDFFKNKEENEVNVLKSSDDMAIKNAVFNTIESAEVFSDIFELFTLKFWESHAQIIDTLPNSEYEHDENMLFDYFDKKRKGFYNQ